MSSTESMYLLPGLMMFVCIVILAAYIVYMGFDYERKIRLLKEQNAALRKKISDGA